jgi:hypothetical protein
MIEWFAMGGGLVVILAAISYRPAKRLLREIEIERACELFKLQRERLEVKFLELASASGKPKGLRWNGCEFHSPVAFARDKESGDLSAFVEVTIRFTAVEGGGMENVQAVSNLRHATAVFHYHRGQWGTGGRALFNMTPDEALVHFSEQYEPAVVG